MNTTGDLDTLVRALDAALPQTQCTRCGYVDCHAYAVAMAGGEAGINLCPPGGAEGVDRLAAITGRAPLALDPARGVESPRSVVVIDESWCIGCTLCLNACPVDCIVGGPKSMHTVIQAQCTGCELCLAACPVDCISLVPASGARTGWQAWSPAEADAARARYAFHRIRIETSPHARSEAQAPVRAKDSVIAAALARARASRTP